MRPTAVVRAGAWLLAVGLVTACAVSSAPKTQVDGRLVTNAGAPRSGLKVATGGQATTTDGEGAFTLTVAAPYDVRVLETSPLVAHAFEGLTTDTPVARVGDEIHAVVSTQAAPTSVGDEAVVRVTLPLATAANTTAVVCGQSSDAIVTGCLRIPENNPVGPYDWDVRWFGASEIDLKVYVLFVEDVDGVASGYPVPSGTRYLLLAAVTPDLDDPAAWLNDFGPVTDAELNGGPGTTSDGAIAFSVSRTISIR